MIWLLEVHPEKGDFRLQPPRRLHPRARFVVPTQFGIQFQGEALVRNRVLCARRRETPVDAGEGGEERVDLIGTAQPGDHLHHRVAAAEVHVRWDAADTRAKNMTLVAVPLQPHAWRQNQAVVEVNPVLQVGGEGVAETVLVVVERSGARVEAGTVDVLIVGFLTKEADADVDPVAPVRQQSVPRGPSLTARHAEGPVAVFSGNVPQINCATGNRGIAVDAQVGPGCSGRTPGGSSRGRYCSRRRRNSRPTGGSAPLCAKANRNSGEPSAGPMARSWRSG